MLLKLAKGKVPRISETERQALEAGTVWVDGELFSGRPDFGRMLREPWPILTERERAFLDGPVETVCTMADPGKEPSPEVWRYLKEQGFFGLAIPPEYGGHGFSALALSTIFGKLASRSLPLSAIVLIPNSVGPGELLLEYGTPEQKAHYLPRLALGDEIPCFALTEPEAGSDAASLRSEGVLFRGRDGQLALRLTWQKRYITLAPVATLLGLAFRLRDPGNLLGKGEDVGITVALVPTHLPGVKIGDRHDPLGVPFPNGPTEGKDVLVPAEAILGGPACAGLGWKMLMEALSAGRAISLPAQSVGGAKYTARVVGAYSMVRKQFGIEIGRFEGIEEPLARIGGLLYLMEAARVFTCGGVDAGHRPSVLSAVSKYHQTELARALVQDGMDVMGGAAICLGPRNLMARGHIGAPIGITVEGANILTRTLILFGQGAIRCHPYVQREMRALETGDAKELRKALLGHAGFFLKNLVRSRLPGRSPVAGPTVVYYRKLARASARFALLTDLALLSLGSRLKKKEKLSGRFADVLSWMYLGFCTLRRFEAEGRRPEDLPLVRWAAEHTLARIQTAFEGIRQNFEGPLRILIPRGRIGAPPSDRLGAEVASILRKPGEQRDRLTADVFLPADPGEALARLERAFVLTWEDAPEAAAARADALQVDSFPAEEPVQAKARALAATIAP